MEKLENQLVKFQDSNSNEIVCLITNFEEIKNINGFRISFRYYNITQENGGFETTVWISNSAPEMAKAYCGTISEINQTAKAFGAKVNSKKTDNKVGTKFQFQQIKKKLLK